LDYVINNSLIHHGDQVASYACDMIVGLSVSPGKHVFNSCKKLASIKVEINT